MDNQGKSRQRNEKDIEKYRKARTGKLSRLGEYSKDYNSDKFIVDLKIYFNNEVDFNLKKVRQTIEAPGKLDGLIEKAKKKNTHPVTEFVQEIFKDLGSSGDIPWEP